jgi:hypothetical protein
MIKVAPEVSVGEYVFVSVILEGFTSVQAAQCANTLRAVALRARHPAASEP